MLKQIVRAALVCCFSTLLAISVAAQDNSGAKSDGVKRPALQTDTNIKSNSAVNSEDEKIPAPESKGGPKAKGGGCMVHVNNETPWIVTVYFEGQYVGAVGRYGDAYMPITSGYAVLYARADFDNGSVRTFGPNNFRCDSGAYTWTLTR
jgi:hypothetical protein